MSKKLSFEELSLFSSENGFLLVPDPAPQVGQDVDTFAASCVYAAVVTGSRFRCPLLKCPQSLQKCF